MAYCNSWPTDPTKVYVTICDDNDRGSVWSAHATTRKPSVAAELRLALGELEAENEPFTERFTLLSAINLKLQQLSETADVDLSSMPPFVIVSETVEGAELTLAEAEGLVAREVDEGQCWEPKVMSVSYHSGTDKLIRSSLEENRKSILLYASIAPVYEIGTGLTRAIDAHPAWTLFAGGKSSEFTDSESADLHRLAVEARDQTHELRRSFDLNLHDAKIWEQWPLDLGDAVQTLAGPSWDVQLIDYKMLKDLETEGRQSWSFPHYGRLRSGRVEYTVRSQGAHQ